jgi:2-C-methyl-D-erythritol 4-phosphate cytidylyltransferase/2-C-methyl-D-erythritol 2,4-cyclodiphosphate synthase
MKNAVIIVAAGKGIRAAAAGARPKQYLDLSGEPVLRRTLSVFLHCSSIDCVQPVIDPDHRLFFDQAIAGLRHVDKIRPPVFGGRSRQASVLSGLRALKTENPRNVLIHDAARPFVTEAMIEHTLASLVNKTACLVAQPLADTLKAEEAGLVARTINRDKLWRAQTPQGFRFQAILAAHELAEREGLADFTDDAALAEWQGIDVEIVMGGERNIKLTTAEDFELAERLLDNTARSLETRLGNGFDVHAFEPGNEVVLCGIPIPHDARLAGHSDADVGLHALTDALLGAIGAGDIGHHFPPSDPQWKGAASDLFLRHAGELVGKAGGRIVNVDVTLICEHPKIGPYREPMRARIAEILEIEVSRVGVKATTTEGLGFTGRREGIAAMASAAVELNRKG